MTENTIRAFLLHNGAVAGALQTVTSPRQLREHKLSDRRARSGHGSVRTQGLRSLREAHKLRLDEDADHALESCQLTAASEDLRLPVLLCSERLHLPELSLHSRTCAVDLWQELCENDPVQHGPAILDACRVEKRGIPQRFVQHAMPELVPRLARAGCGAA